MRALGETGGQSRAFVWEGDTVRGTSSAVLKATVTRTPECRLFRLITFDMLLNMLVSKA